MQKNIADIRNEYIRQALTEKDVDKDPIQQFQHWLSEAVNSEVREPTAMNLSTLSENGIPSSRIVLLKGVNTDGFTFFTNYQSTKGRELEKHPIAALNFFWPELERQVRIQGYTDKISREESEKYFQSRPKSSQIGAWASPQSSVIKNREILEEREKMIADKYQSYDVLPKPEQWGGYIVKPFLIEFWQGRPSRLHDRILFTKEEEGSTWEISRLAP